MFTVLQRKDQTNDYSVSSFWIREEGGGGDFLPKFICRFEMCNVDIIFRYVKITVQQMKEKWAEET